jgi:hypothetical protein
MKKLTVLGQELNIKLSHSFIQNAACPFYLKCNYVDRLQERYVRIPAERGKAAHEAVYALLRGCIEKSIMPQDLPDDLIREAVAEFIPHQILGESGDIFNWVRLWAERFKGMSHIVGIEEKIGLDDEYDETDFSDASYRGIIDLLQMKHEHAVITDWKSQPHIMSQTELDEHEQMTFYCWLVWKLYPEIEKFTARIWYLRYGFYAETVRTEEDLEAFEHALMIKERKIAEIDSWDPIPGKHCQYCDFIMNCPIAQDLGPENPHIISQEQAIIAAQKLTVIETLRKQLTDGLKDYVKANDDVRIGDNWVYGFHARTSSKWDPKKLSDVLAEHDLDLAEYVNVDARKLQKLLKTAAKEDPGLEAALEEITEESHRTEFKGAQLKAG